MVTVRGKQYTIVSKYSAAGSGPKYFGKFVFILKDSDGNYFRALGKTLTANARIIPTDYKG